jgi:ADP-heptose:LPS heptosyltransferase
MIVAVDNGPKNLAVALNVPTVSVFGPTDPLSFDPHNDPRHISFRGTGGTTDSVSAEMVIDSINTILK